MKTKSLLPLLFVLCIAITNNVSFAQSPCYTVNPITYNSEIVSGIPVLVNIDDVWSAVIPISFNFCFYGTTYNQCIIGSNEVISFNLTNAITSLEPMMH